VILTSAAGCSGNSDNTERSVKSEPESIQMPKGASEITFPASDNRKVYADFYKSKNSDSKKVVLMFHQARSNAGEYETIAPKITAIGFDCVALDQRSGFDMWNRVNRTVNRSGTGTYMEAYNDMVGALKWAESKKYTTIVAWGSSYSSSLTLRLASENSSLNAVLLFSPGEYMDDKTVVREWAAKDTVPTFFACTPDEWTDGRSDIYLAIPSKTKTEVSLPGGVHGSSTLIPDKSSAADQYMEKVVDFLKGLGSSKS